MPETENTQKAPAGPFAHMPMPEIFPSLPEDEDLIPDDAACFALWDKFAMLENIRAHSMKVAHIATELAKYAQKQAIPVSIKEARAAALLHDLAKTYCVRNGGAHALLGASWVIQSTGLPRIAQAVILHVQWPWPLPAAEAICTVPFFVMYADKRVKHDRIVSLAERYEDLLERYGKTEAAQAGIRASWRQSIEIENSLSQKLGINLASHPFA